MKRNFSDKNMSKFSDDLSRQDLALPLGAGTNANISYNNFFEKISHTRDKYMPQVKRKFNRKKKTKSMTGSHPVF